MLTNRYLKYIICLIGGLFLMVLLIPIPSYAPKYSKVLYSKEGKLLSALVSSEQQWCFPLEEEIPDRLVKAIITYEDDYYYYHLGVNPVSIIKAAISNFKAKKTVRGASTIPMQLMRMKNKHVERSVANKIWEAISAFKISITKSKNTILKNWCEIAPFGGNTIGVKAASLIYFGREINNLSWSEYALLAVMPNGPSSAHLGKNRKLLKDKRDFLLEKLCNKGYFSLSELTLYKDESLPEKTYSFDQEALHLLQYLSIQYPDKYIFESTIHYTQQLALNKLLVKEAEYLQADDINNMATIIIDVNTNELISYVGNINSKSGEFRYVDIAQSPRSYGSILKPLLYAYALEYGHALPNELIPDIPTHIGEFHPENFDKKYRGAVALDEMIIQSLNVPAVRLLNKVGLESFYNEIEKLQIAELNKGSDHYGLSLILGGGESTLWDLCRLYKGLARNKLEFKNPFNKVNILKSCNTNQELIDVNYRADALTYLIEAMADVNRPREEKSWTKYNQDYKIAWKTGTSYGHKDAWAMGFNSKYMIGVWVGNENGEGRFNLTGVTKAAPIMFKAFNSMKDNKWFDKNQSSKNKITVCTESGKMAGVLCNKTHQIDFQSSHKLIHCRFHLSINLDEEGRLISEDCNKKIFNTDTVFVLPASMEYYYKKEHISYINIPSLADNCISKNNRINIIYPENGVKIFLPKDGIDQKNELVSKAYHSNNNATLFWFIDDQYVSTTYGLIHENIIKSEAGIHNLSVIDQDGNKESITFELLAAN